MLKFNNRQELDLARLAYQNAMAAETRRILVCG